MLRAQFKVGQQHGRCKMSRNVHFVIAKEILSSSPVKQHFRRFCVLGGVGPLGTFNIYTSQLDFFPTELVALSLL